MRCRRCDANLMRLVKLRLAARHAAARGEHARAWMLDRHSIDDPPQAVIGRHDA